MKVGDIVMVKTNSFVDKHSRIFSDIRPHFYKGIVEFVSDRWATVMLFSNNTKAPNVSTIILERRHFCKKLKPTRRKVPIL